MINYVEEIKKYPMSKKLKNTFNPIKEDKDGVRAKRVVWSTESLNLALKGMEQGRKLIANPFYENNTKILKGDLVFERTPEEIEEWKKCKNDILYFAEKYCQLMTPQGIQPIQLRDYQKEYLRHLEQNRLSILLACRQAGKCVNLTEKVIIRLKNPYKKFNKYLKDGDRLIYELPLFELYNLVDKRFIWKIKYFLYKIIYNIEIQKNI